MSYTTENDSSDHQQPCEEHISSPSGVGDDDGDPSLMLPTEAHYDPTLAAAAEYYQTGGYWHIGTQMMDCLFQTDRIADVAFDPLEELIWCVTRAGQMSAFYSTTMERYITLTVPLLSDVNSLETVTPYSELKQVFPSPRPMEHSVFVLANNALHAYTKMGRPLASAVNKFMLELECLAVTGPTGTLAGSGIRGSSCAIGNFAKFFLGGLQPTLLEMDAVERWGEVINTIDVGIGGSVVLRPFSGGLCAGNTNGKVMIIDSRTSHGIVRELDAHTGEISDMTVDANSHTLVTCGWSRVGDSGLRVDRLLRVYDLRSGRAQVPLSASLDPCFVRFIPGCSDSLLATSQTGAFQTIQWGKIAFSPNDLGQLWLGYDRLVATDISQNGNCVAFATEAGQLHLYIHDLNLCQFNISPLPTEFASPFPESLWPTNTLQTTLPVNYSLMIFDDPNSSLYGTNLAAIGKTAAESINLQVLAASLHQPSESLSSPDFANLVEHRKAEAAREAVLNAYKPIEFDDYRFSLASVPFAAFPPPIIDPANPIENETGFLWKTKLNTISCTSDWPEDLNESQHKIMEEVDPDLLNNANKKRAVRKPPQWGTVWHPYSTEITHDGQLGGDYSSPLEFGRFEHVAPFDKVSTSTTSTTTSTTLPAVTSSKPLTTV
ncbi:hypothetical protein MN116_000705 [Schistosoma mekongi]|uniref:PAN2-PAN3 deadenylation complex catalytic subunit PAN2 N-terminal domain-containing protein n=1 Tax=Schistosoma mekongi TaxID=38744 RepID=A0AAE1ZHV2_SCHME|nr:hypothetical protein MN116_000705 [Schistosoma mekongi]